MATSQHSNLAKFQTIAFCTPTLRLTPEAAKELAVVKRSVDALGNPVASAVGFTPYGTIVATDVQGALEELSDEKASAASVASGLAGKQPLDATLSAVAGVATAADRLIYWTGVDVAALATFTPFARTLVDDPDATAARATLGLGNVDNTSDANKPVSTAQATAIGAKLDTSAAPELIRDTIGTALVAGANITLTVSDPGDTITVAASGGGGGSTSYARTFLLMGS